MPLPRPRRASPAAGRFPAAFRRAAIACAAAAVALTAAPPRTQADPAIPDTPAGARFREILEVLNGGDEHALRAYVEARFTPSMRKTGPADPGIAAFLAGQQARGGFDVVRVLDSAPFQVGMLVRARGDSTRTLRYVVGVEPDPPHRISGIFVFDAPPDARGSEAPPLTAGDAVRELDRAVERLAAEGLFSGAVLLARDGVPVLRRAYGEADRASHVPNRPETLFSLASLNKMFTAVAVGRLVEEGRVGWNDPVAKHLEGWLAPGLAERITIAHLLTHTSGLGDYLDKIADDERARSYRDVASFRTLCAEAGIEGAPGEGFRYSNLGYVVLGAVIESVTGRDYFDFVRDVVYRPAGMPRTDSYFSDADVGERAAGYCRAKEIGRGGDEWIPNGTREGVRGTPAGGGWSNVDDLLAFANALTGHVLLDEATTRELLTPRLPTPMGGHYGYGFLIGRSSAGGAVVGHAGGFPGVSTLLRVAPDERWTLVVLANVSGGADLVGEAWRGLAARVAAGEP